MAWRACWKAFCFALSAGLGKVFAKANPLAMSSTCDKESRNWTETWTFTICWLWSSYSASCATSSSVETSACSSNFRSRTLFFQTCSQIHLRKAVVTTRTNLISLQSIIVLLSVMRKGQTSRLTSAKDSAAFLKLERACQLRTGK